MTNQLPIKIHFVCEMNRFKMSLNEILDHKIKCDNNSVVSVMEQRNVQWQFPCIKIKPHRC